MNIMRVFRREYFIGYHDGLLMRWDYEYGFDMLISDAGQASF